MADTRTRLIDAGMAILSEGAPLTIRGVAARAGVSHAAPAHHFASLDALRAAIMAEGFRAFAEAMREGIAASDGSPRGRALGAGKGYIAFASVRPALFGLMFAGQFGAHCALAPELEPAADDAYDVLRDVAGGLEAPPEVAEAMLWSLVHGFAALHQAGHIEAEEPAAVAWARLADRLPWREKAA